MWPGVEIQRLERRVLIALRRTDMLRKYRRIQKDPRLSPYFSGAVNGAPAS